jgi:heme/copper-type cytochrome/quinol oxidase subunit 4
MERQMSDPQESQSHCADAQAAWSPEVRRLLVDWCDRADATSKTHYAMADKFSFQNKALGIPVVVLTTLVGTSVFATLQETVNTTVRIIVGFAIALAAVLASLQTFLGLGERTEKNRAAAENWSAIRREITEILALHPAHPETHGDPKKYLDKLRARIDEVAAESPEMPSKLWGNTYEPTADKKDENKPGDRPTGR